MRTIALAISIIGLFGNVSFSQAVGSRAGYRQMISGEQRAADAMASFNQATKLTRSLTKPISGALSPEAVRLQPSKLEPSQTGKLDYWKTTVVVVVDDRNSILQVGKTMIWLNDFPTANLLTDQQVRIIDYVKVGEPKDYNEHRLPSITLVSLEDNSQLTAKEQKIVEREQDIAAQNEAAKLRDFRKWHSKSGADVEGKFIRFRSPSVEIELQNGKKNTFRITALTDEDAELVRKLAKEDLEAKKVGK